MQKATQQEIAKAGKPALLSLVDTIGHVEKMIRVKGEQPSTALIAGYINLMTVRVLDDIDKRRKED